MARSEARLFTARNADDDWRALPFEAQWLYDTLLTQHDLSHAGVLRLSVRRWSRLAAGLTQERVQTALDALVGARFVVVDEDTEELLIRALLRRDGTWKSVLTLRAAQKSAQAIESPALRLALAEEVERVDPSSLPEGRNRSEVRALLGEIVRTLRGRPDGGPEGVSEGVSQGVSEGASSKGYRKPLGKPQGVGAGAVVAVPTGHSGTATEETQTLPSRKPTRAKREGEWMSQVVEARRSAGATDLRSWSSAACANAVQRAAEEHEVTPDVAWQALVELATEADTQHPGRLTHQLQRVLEHATKPRQGLAAVPAHCGACDETRHVEDDQGRAMRCPTCHPLRRSA